MTGGLVAALGGIFAAGGPDEVAGVARFALEQLDPLRSTPLVGAAAAAMVLSGPGGRAVRLVAAVGVLGGFWVAFPLGAVAFGAAAAAVVPLSGRKMLLVGVAGFGFWMAVAGGVNWWAAHQADVPGRVAADLAGRVAPLLTVGAVTVAAVLVWSVAYRPRLDPLRYATAEQRAEVTRRDGYRCSYCGADGHAPGVDLQMDHRKAHSRGGKTVTKNLMWLCSACNRFKGNLPEWQGRRRAKNAARAKRRRGAFS